MWRDLLFNYPTFSPCSSNPPCRTAKKVATLVIEPRYGRRRLRTPDRSNALAGPASVFPVEGLEAFCRDKAHNTLLLQQVARLLTLKSRDDIVGPLSHRLVGVRL